MEAKNANVLLRRISEINLQLRNLTHKKIDIYYVAPNPTLCNTTGFLLEDYHVGDGIHLNPRGNSIWIKTLKERIKQIDDSPG